MSWTEEKVATMIRLRDQGYSSSQIGGVLGVTRNAVIGKVHRLGLQVVRLPKKAGMIAPSRVDGVPRSRKRKLISPRVLEMKRLAEKMRAVEVPPATLLPNAPPSATGVLGVSFVELAPNGCKFAVNRSKSKDDPHLFCNAPRMFGKPYCCEHFAAAYVKPHRTNKRFVMRRAA
jgi:GcrA cell cycle regulator